MNNILLRRKKIGFIGAGNMTQAIITGLIESKTLVPGQIYVSNRSEGKLEKLKKQWGVNTFSNNEEVIDNSDIIFLAVKPQDFSEAMESVASSFNYSQVIVSLAAGISLKDLQRFFPDVKAIFRVMANTAVRVRESVFGYCHTPGGAQYLTLIEDLLEPLGQSFALAEGDAFEGLTVGTSSSIGFIYELMMYWQDWLEEHDIAPQEAKDMTVKTFLGAALLAEKSNNQSLEELRDRVVSKNGVTDAGLKSMRELELERILRISFGKAVDKDKELSELL